MPDKQQPQTDFVLFPACCILGKHKNKPFPSEVTPVTHPENGAITAAKINELEQPVNLDTDSVFE